MKDRNWENPARFSTDAEKRIAALRAEVRQLKRLIQEQAEVVEILGSLLLGEDKQRV